MKWMWSDMQTLTNFDWVVLTTGMVLLVLGLLSGIFMFKNAIGKEKMEDGRQMVLLLLFISGLSIGLFMTWITLP